VKKDTTRQLKKRMLEALRQTLGIVTTACDKAGVSRATHYRWMSEDPKYKEAVGDLAEVAVDFAESSLFQQIRNQEASATIFFLKTKARHRGYVERKDLDVTSKGEHIAKPPIAWTDDASDE
jgi:hypothetical protein